MLFTTIEGKVQNGVIVPMEPVSISTGSRVLITILPEPKDTQLQWDACKNEAGWLTLKEDPAAWQQHVRNEWSSRP